MIVCEFEDGGKGKLRHVTVGTLAINEKKEVLLVKRAVSSNFGKYAVPGGFLDRDENTQQAALRELKEETGYDGKIAYLFKINTNPNRPKEDRQNVDFIYLIDIVGGRPTENKESSEIKWFDRADLPSEDEFAFDHRELILRYFRHLEKPEKLPIVG